MTILIQEDKEIEEAHKIYKKFTQNEELLELYEAREKFKKDYNSIMAAKIEEAEKKGMQKKAITIAKTMKDKGFDVKTIAETTGLSAEEIEKL